MPGPILTAGNAAKKYKGKGIKRSGSKVTLKNSSGKKVTVQSGANVYHRGKGKFGIYSTTRDANRFEEGTPRGKTNRIGTGSYRQTDDRRRTGKQKSRS